MVSLLRELEQAKPSRIEPCLPTKTVTPPNGPGWLHEIKYDGYRMMVQCDASGIRVITRNGFDWTARYPLITTAAKAIKAKAFLIDGEAVVCDDRGLADFERMRHRRNDPIVCLYAIDLLSLNETDLRNEPIEKTEGDTSKIVAARKIPACSSWNNLDSVEGDIVFARACELGCEGIVSKRLALATYRAARATG